MLNERQKSLYEYLLYKSTTTEEFISKESICKDLYQLYPRHAERTTEHNSTVFNCIRHDIATINDEPVGEYKIVAANSKGYRIANKEEAEKYIQRRFKQNLKALKRTWALQKKAGLDGQMELGEETKEIRTLLGG